MPLASLPPLEACRVYVLDPAACANAAGCSVRDPSWALAAERASTPVPPAWEDNQYAAELWLQRSLARHPWRVGSSAQSDVVFVAANMSLFCFVGRAAYRHSVYFHLKRTGWLGPVPPKFLTVQYGRCKAPWKLEGLSGEWPVGVHALLDRVPERRRGAVISPFVVSQPAWLVAAGGAGAGAPAAVPWAARKLVFFAGHVPKLYVSTLRFNLWRALVRRKSEATVVSSTLACTVGSFAGCRMGKARLLNQSNEWMLNRCVALCGNASETASRIGGRSARNTCGANPSKPSRENAGHLARLCKAYRRVDFDAELGDMVATTRRLTHAAYLAEAMRHRFCLIAPGDFASTQKVTETIAVGGLGGCACVAQP